MVGANIQRDSHKCNDGHVVVCEDWSFAYSSRGKSQKHSDHGNNNAYAVRYDNIIGPILVDVCELILDLLFVRWGHWNSLSGSHKGNRLKYIDLEMREEFVNEA